MNSHLLPSCPYMKRLPVTGRASPPPTRRTRAGRGTTPPLCSKHLKRQTWTSHSNIWDQCSRSDLLVCVFVSRITTVYFYADPFLDFLLISSDESFFNYIKACATNLLETFPVSALHPSVVPWMRRSHLTVTLVRVLSHGNVPQTPELCSFILNLALTPDPFTMGVGNTAYFPPSATRPVRTRPGPSRQVPDCNSQEQVLCSPCRCPSSASHRGLKSGLSPALHSLSHTRTRINKTKKPFILNLKQWATSFSWVTVRPQNTSRTKRPS